MHDVFISYSSKDLRQAETVRNVLEKNGIPCWMAPRDIPGGSNYTKEIPIAIRSCQVFVLILSRNAQNSHWVLKELDSAVNCGKVILPFMLENVQLNDEFNFLLTGAQRYAAYQKKAEALETLITRIRAITHHQDTGAGGKAPSQDLPEIPSTVSDETGFYTAQCPACGSEDLQEQAGKIGRFTLLEQLTIVLMPALCIVSGFVSLILGALLAVILGLSDISTPVILITTLGGMVGGWVLGGKLSTEWIRRHRVRRHICQHPYRCRSCSKEFLLEESKVS